MKKINSRRLEQGVNPGEIIGNYYYSTESEPPYTIQRRNISNGDEEIVFSLNEIPELKKFSEKQRNSISSPVIRLSDDETKILVIVDTLSNDRPTL